MVHHRGIPFTVCIGLGVALWVLVRRTPRRSRPEDGHDRAARREESWYGSAKRP